VQRTAILLFVLLVACACGGSSPTSSQPPTSPSPVPSASPTPVPTANPAETIFKRSEALMPTLGYTVNRQWLRPQQQTVAPVLWKPGQAPEMTMLAVDSPAYSFSSTTDTSPRCPNAICYVVHVAGAQHGSASTCTPTVLVNADVYIDGTSSRNLSRHVVAAGGGTGCPVVDVEGWDSITFP
jgi:hypothetical protein